VISVHDYSIINRNCMKSGKNSDIVMDVLKLIDRFIACTIINYILINNYDRNLPLKFGINFEIQLYQFKQFFFKQMLSQIYYICSYLISSLYMVNNVGNTLNEESYNKT